jgi:hypothetical protein
MMTLAEFLAARLGDDEAAAEAAIAEEPEGECGCPPGDWSYRDRVGSRDDYGVLHHEMRHDPARVLREAGAGREILGGWEDPAWVRDLSLHPDSDPEHPPQDGRDPDEIEEQVAVAEVIDHHVRLLAAVYADHPDYDEAWRP